MKSTYFGLIAIAACGVAAFAAGLQVEIWLRQVEGLLAAQETTNDRIVALRNTMDALLDLETGQRGYLLVGEEAYLAPYQRGRVTLKPALAALAQDFRGEPDARKQVDDLTAIAEARLQTMSHAIELRRRGEAGAALAVVQAGEGKRLMDAFRDKAGALLRSLRDSSTKLGRKVKTKFDQTIVLGATLIALILLLVAVAVGRLSVTIRRLDALQRMREREAMHDPLTALPNRRYLLDWLRIAVAAAQRGGRRLALLYFDLDGFKEVNDRLGHEAGDRVLQVMAERLKSAMRTSDFVARLGGDEFVAVLSDAPTEPNLSVMIGRLSDTLAKAPLPDMTDGEVSASIGVARFPGDAGSPEALLSAADRAMYVVKERRRAGAPQPRSAAAAVVT
jgi:diguanylate cyclase (GGDEF)-like protein